MNEGPGESRVQVRRVAACGVVSVTGAAVFVPNAARLAMPSEPPIGLFLAVLGALLSVLLMALGVKLFYGDVSTPDAERIAVWNSATLLALGAVLSLVLLYQRVGSPTVLVGNLLSVSAFVNVVVGIEGVRQLRAERLVAEREKLLVLNRLVRHNLRNEAQVLVAAGNHLRENADDDDMALAASAICDSATALAGMRDDVTVMQRLVEGTDEPGPMDVTDVARAVVETTSEDATVPVVLDAPDRLLVEGTPLLRDALREVVENALEHASASRVTVDVTERGDVVEVSVSDDGRGLPDVERAVVSGETAITQLEHGSGLGLWVVKWVVQSMDGRLVLGRSDAGGALVTIQLDAA